MMPNSHDIVVFTDGSSRGNPGPGGFGAILILPSQDEKNTELGIKNFEVREIGGREIHTTNNRMELQAAIEALSFLSNVKGSASAKALADRRRSIVFYTDSSYLINGITKWVLGWRKNDWKTTLKKDVENRDLWEKLIDVAKEKQIEWKYVSGHVGVA